MIAHRFGCWRERLIFDCGLTSGTGNINVERLDRLLVHLSGGQKGVGAASVYW